MELRHLRYFIAVAEEGSVTGAAARLFVAQPSVSRQLRALERHVGARLLVRSSRGVALTAEGELLLPLAYRLVQDAAALTGLFDTAAGARFEVDAAPGARHRLTVGLIDGALGPLTAPILAAFRAAHPAIDLRVRPVLYPELDSCLETGRIDALLTVAGTTDPETTRFHGLFDDAMHGALPAASPLARAAALTLDDVLELPVVQTGPAPHHRTAPFLLADHRNGERPRAVDAPAPARRDDVLVQVADRGAFVALPATGSVRPSPGVAFVPIADATRLPSGVAVARRAAEPALVGAFRTLAQVVTGELLPLLPTARLLPCG